MPIYPNREPESICDNCGNEGWSVEEYHGWKEGNVKPELIALCDTCSRKMTPDPFERLEESENWE